MADDTVFYASVYSGAAEGDIAHLLVTRAISYADAATNIELYLERGGFPSRLHEDFTGLAITTKTFFGAPTGDEGYVRQLIQERGRYDTAEITSTEAKSLVYDTH